MNKTSTLKYSSDVRSIVCVLINLTMSLVPFLLKMPIWVLVPYFGAIIYARSYAPYAQHNHGHLPVFNSRFLNSFYNILLAQCTGYATSLWELHHVRGHHRHFLTPEHDVARITHPESGKLMARWWYALRGNLTIVFDSIKIARQEAMVGQKSLLPKLYAEITGQVLVTAALALWNPWMTLFFFVLPNLSMSWFIWWESYQHHLGVPMNDAYDGSVTITHRWFNFQTFNIGHHTAHHEKPTLHWSLLPKRTEAILTRIPEECLQEKYHFFAKSLLNAPRNQKPTYHAEHQVSAQG